MTKLSFLILFALFLVQVHSWRLIYRDPALDQTTVLPKPETETVKANMIAAPWNCKHDERLDRMNKCRKVSSVRMC